MKISYISHGFVHQIIIPIESCTSQLISNKRKGYTNEKLVDKNGVRQFQESGPG